MKQRRKASTTLPPAPPRFKPGDRVLIARGPGKGLSGVVCVPRPGDPASASHIGVQFDLEPGIRYWSPIAGLELEATPKKPPRTSVQRRVRAARRA